MNKKHKTTLTTLLVATVLLAGALFAGCASTPDPIRTTLDLQTTEQGLPAFNYASEKDVIYSRSFDGTSEVVEFKALASAAAYAQAEREQVQAEAQRAQAEALSAAVRALGANAAGVMGAESSD